MKKKRIPFERFSKNSKNWKPQKSAWKKPRDIRDFEAVREGYGKYWQ